MKSRHKYIIKVEDESHLSNIASWRIRPWLVIILVPIVLAVVISSAVAVIMSTPLKNMLPGYMPPQERAATIDDLVKVDSLQRLYDMNEAYLANLKEVMDVDRRGGDSLQYAAKGVTADSDSLMPASQTELEFRKMMEKREKFNLSILAPLAADGMKFEDPAPGYAFAHGSEDERTATLIVPTPELIRALTDGLVIDVHYNPAEGYSVTMQHANGFLSRFRRLGLPLVVEGDEVPAGQVLAPTANGTGRNGAIIILEMWRNGTRLLPYHILRGVGKFSQSYDVATERTPAK